MSGKVYDRPGMFGRFVDGDGQYYAYYGYGPVPRFGDGRQNFHPGLEAFGSAALGALMGLRPDPGLADEIKTSFVEGKDLPMTYEDAERRCQQLGVVAAINVLELVPAGQPLAAVESVAERTPYTPLETVVGQTPDVAVNFVVDFQDFATLAANEGLRFAGEPAVHDQLRAA
jgi:hypothetical protein